MSEHTVRVSRELVPGVTIVATYSGGAYIDVARKGQAPSEVINVWDYECGGPTIDVSVWDVGQALDRWIDSYDEDSPADSALTLAHDVVTHW